MARRAIAAAAAALAAGAVAGTAPAGAHVHAVSPGAVRGSVAIVVFEVPNESPTGSATTELTVTLPEATSARTETKPGWTVRMERDSAAGTVRSVTWTATAGEGIDEDQFGLFRVSMKLPNADTVRFAAIQRYADGTAVHWDQPPLPGGGEPDRPAPELDLVPGPVAPPEHHAAPEHPAPSVSATAPAPTATTHTEQPNAVGDTQARLLAGAALLVAALGVTIAIIRRRT